MTTQHQTPDSAPNQAEIDKLILALFRRYGYGPRFDELMRAEARESGLISGSGATVSEMEKIIISEMRDPNVSVFGTPPTIEDIGREEARRMGMLRR